MPARAASLTRFLSLLPVQGVADLLATNGVKKPQAERALDALVEQKKLVGAGGCWAGPGN